MFVVYDLGVLIAVTIRVPVGILFMQTLVDREQFEVKHFVCWGALGCQYTRVVFHSFSLKMFKLFGLHFVKIKDRVDNN